MVMALITTLMVTNILQEEEGMLKLFTSLDEIINFAPSKHFRRVPSCPGRLEKPRKWNSQISSLQ